MKPDKFITNHNLREFQLLREFVLKGLWSPALQSCDEAISSCEAKILRLKELKTLIAGEK